jgi:hexosaminidase
MNEVVKKHGKKTIVWEGFHKEGKVVIPRDITVMIFECLYNLPADLISDGYPVINTAWQPIYVVGNRAWSPEYIYGWNMYRWENCWNKSAAYGKGIKVEPTKQVLGAQMCAWEQSDQIEVRSLRERLPAMSERIWNPDATCDFTNFAARLRITDASLTKLLQGGESKSSNNKRTGK